MERRLSSRIKKPTSKVLESDVVENNQVKSVEIAKNNDCEKLKKKKKEVNIVTGNHLSDRSIDNVQSKGTSSSLGNRNKSSRRSAQQKCKESDKESASKDRSVTPESASQDRSVTPESASQDRSVTPESASKDRSVTPESASKDRSVTPEFKGKQKIERSSRSRTQEIVESKIETKDTESDELQEQNFDDQNMDVSTKDTDGVKTGNSKSRKTSLQAATSAAKKIKIINAEMVSGNEIQFKSCVVEAEKDMAIEASEGTKAETKTGKGKQKGKQKKTVGKELKRVISSEGNDNSEGHDISVDDKAIAEYKEDPTSQTIEEKCIMGKSRKLAAGLKAGTYVLANVKKTPVVKLNKIEPELKTNSGSCKAGNCVTPKISFGTPYMKQSNIPYVKPMFKVTTSKSLSAINHLLHSKGLLSSRSMQTQVQVTNASESVFMSRLDLAKSPNNEKMQSIEKGNKIGQEVNKSVHKATNSVRKSGDSVQVAENEIDDGGILAEEVGEFADTNDNSEMLEHNEMVMTAINQLDLLFNGKGDSTDVGKDADQADKQNVISERDGMDKRETAYELENVRNDTLDDMVHWTDVKGTQTIMYSNKISMTEESTVGAKVKEKYYSTKAPRKKYPCEKCGIVLPTYSQHEVHVASHLGEYF